MYRQRCTGEHAVLFSQVAKITHHYCILTRIQPRATALQEGFGEGYSTPFSYGRTRPSTPRSTTRLSWGLFPSRVSELGRTREISVEGRGYQRSRGLIDLSDLFCQLEQRGKLRFCRDLVSQVALSVISVENKTRHCRNINDIVFASPRSVLLLCSEKFFRRKLLLNNIKFMSILCVCFNERVIICVKVCVLFSEHDLKNN